MAYYMQVHIESALTGYTGSKIPSLAGHMWYEVYQRDENGNTEKKVSEKKVSKKSVRKKKCQKKVSKKSVRHYLVHKLNFI